MRLRESSSHEKLAKLPGSHCIKPPKLAIGYLFRRPPITGTYLVARVGLEPTFEAYEAPEFPLLYLASEITQEIIL